MNTTPTQLKTTRVLIADDHEVLADALAIQPHHIDPGCGQIRDEITTRLGQGAYTPALASDVASVPGRDPSIAQRLG